MIKPPTYPHTQERYEADVQRATDYVERHLAPQTPAEPRWQVTLRERSMFRKLAYVVGGVSRLVAETEGAEIARDLGPGYVLESVERLLS